ncbi:hypothetical protein [Paraburkholderia rhynchosiae]|uniref:Uncharacterized protein n=1 Tax=Paraburkholderia rhynchosiae TaxID=487049 RepID=A0A2N7WU36_9BURK|nr:hypothetical protein [Paraburkholderia rhynchosiae]PMS32851.1 hypothetical protein C0Z16_04700 [Paraburkholderia rhynchosiae]CAB3645719.1 hypothetical protein LMG27174_00838 [Paraburkholderia rhynchosiae]
MRKTVAMSALMKGMPDFDADDNLEGAAAELCAALWQLAAQRICDGSEVDPQRAVIAARERAYAQGAGAAIYGQGVVDGCAEYIRFTFAQAVESS